MGLIDLILSSYIQLYMQSHDVKSKVRLLNKFYLKKFGKPSPGVEICKYNSTSTKIKSTA